MSTEGIFRRSGSVKRVQDLQRQFDSPRYGKDLDWTAYSVYDAADLLKRYFNQLPEPLIPLGFYDRFRGPICALQDYELMHVHPIWKKNSDVEKVVIVYRKLLQELPKLNRYLLLYVLRLLAIFTSRIDENRMTPESLCAIFQPGLLAHPRHNMAPREYKLNHNVLLFLFDHQDQLLSGSDDFTKCM
ncbi:Rho GTPase activation protein [Aspergillus bertholletiae]|uniref:Rho GTPase activation protein n=1 Tax=Aspergillus bertholletiae TaxID=1226010 RepID=A0A5N7BQ41_9EURO|nr:Rho GTPase activation protein [Aspergillus bertholletiae]